MIRLLKVILIILFAGCLFNMPYGYFQIVRFLATMIFVFFTIKEIDQNWKWLWIASSILINPFLKIYLGRFIWNVADIIWIILLIFSLSMDSKKNSKSSF